MFRSGDTSDGIVNFLIELVLDFCCGADSGSINAQDVDRARQMARIHSEPPVGGLIDTSMEFLTAKPIPC